MRIYSFNISNVFGNGGWNDRSGGGVNLKILIVEDNPSDLEGLLRHVRWQQLGYEVAAVARDGAQGLAEALRAPG